MVVVSMLSLLFDSERGFDATLNQLGFKNQNPTIGEMRQAFRQIFSSAEFGPVIAHGQ